MREMRVLTWNLFQGRAVPAAGRDLLPEFSAALAGWDWDVALLQEVRPWWPPMLGRACDASWSVAVTAPGGWSRARRWFAERWPDVAKSSGGGANAILVRAGAGAVVASERVTLRDRPNVRVAHGVGLADGTWVVNVHAQAHSDAQAQADIAATYAVAEQWAGGDGAPLVVGGDMNQRRFPLPPGFTTAAAHTVDHVTARGFVADEPGRTLPHEPLSDHAPLLAVLGRTTTR